MTNEEALEILKSIEILSFRDKKRKYFMADVWKAKKLAIKALEQQPCEDCISRQAVMKCFKKWQPYMATRLWDYEQELKDLPSATPTISKMEQVEDCVARSEALDILDDFEEDVENGKFKTAYAKARERMCELPPVTPSYNSIKSDLKPCEDWKFYYKHGYTQAKRDLLCEDCISREAVDNYIVKLMSGYLYDEERARLEDLTAYIWELPSVIPSRPSGKWKRISPAGIYECTNCNQVIMTSDIDCYKYCHGCGTRMEVNADDNT